MKVKRSASSRFRGHSYVSFSSNSFSGDLFLYNLRARINCTLLLYSKNIGHRARLRENEHLYFAVELSLTEISYHGCVRRPRAESDRV